MSADDGESDEAASFPLVSLTIGESPFARRPSTARYSALLNSLAEAKRGASSEKDDLKSCLEALVAVIEFLKEDRRLVYDKLDEQLLVLTQNLRDLTLGAKPSIFFRRRKQGPGAPANRSLHANMAVMAACITALMEAGMGRGAAARFVATEAARLGIAPRGKPETASGLLRYRDEMKGGRAPQLAQDTYKDVTSAWEKLRREEGCDLPTIKRAARDSLASMSR